MFLLALLLISSLHAQPKPPQPCTELLTDPRVSAYIGLLDKALNDGTLQPPILKKMIREGRLQDPLSDQTDEPFNMAIHKALATFVASASPELKAAVLARLPELLARHGRVATLRVSAHVRTKPVLDGRVTFRHEWVNSHRIFKSELAWFRDSAGQDRLVALNPDALDIRVFDPLGGQEPVFSRRLLEDGDSKVLTARHLSAGPEGPLRLAYWASAKKELRLLTYDRTAEIAVVKLGETPLAVRVQTTKAGEVFVVVTSPSRVQVFEADGEHLTPVSDFKVHLQADTVKTFLNSSDQLMLYGRSGADLMVFQPLTRAEPVEIWPIGANAPVYPFVTREGELVGAAPVEVGGAPAYIDFYRHGQVARREDRLHGLKNDSNVIWHEAADGRLLVAVKGYRENGKSSDHGYSFLAPFDGASNPPTVFKTSQTPYNVQWITTSEGDRILLFDPEQVHVLDEGLHEVQKPVPHHHLASARPGPFIGPDGTLYLAGTGIENFYILNLAQADPAVELIGADHVTEWYRLANGDVVTAKRNSSIPNEQIEVVRLLGP